MGRRITLFDGTFYPPIPSLCFCGCNEITWNGHEYIHNHHTVGRKHTEEEINKISVGNKGKKHSPEHIEKHRKSVTGRKDSEEAKLKKSITHTGMHHDQKTKDLMSKSRLEYIRLHPESIKRGEEHSSWNGGISAESYNYKFNDSLKESIRTRDNFQCQNPNCLCSQLESLMLWEISLHVHHIHYDKQNPCPDLITLCNSCNAKANHNKNYWENLYTNILTERNIFENKEK